MSKLTKKCPFCKGKGCKRCDNSGVLLNDVSGEDYDDVIIGLGGKKYSDEDDFIDFEEDDYDY